MVGVVSPAKVAKEVVLHQGFPLLLPRDLQRTALDFGPGVDARMPQLRRSDAASRNLFWLQKKNCEIKMVMTTTTMMMMTMMIIIIMMMKVKLLIKMMIKEKRRKTNMIKHEGEEEDETPEASSQTMQQPSKTIAVPGLFR